MLKMHQKVLLLIAIATAIISCKKDLQPEPTNSLPPDAQVVKNWFASASTSSFSKHYLNNPDTLPASGKPDWEAIQKIDNINLIPVASDIVSQNNEQEVKKYLAVTTNTSGKPENGYYLYVINKAGASSVTTNELVDYINGLAVKDFEGTIMKYDINNKYIGSLNNSKKEDPASKSSLLAKQGVDTEPVSNYMPLPQGCNYVRIDWYFQHYENGLLVYEIYLYSTYEMNCGDNSGGGSNPDTIPVPHAYNSCLGADSLANNSQFKALFSILKAQTADSSELGFLYEQIKNNPNAVQGTPLQGAIGALELPNVIPVTPIDGFIHSHFKVPGKSLSIFSDADILYLATLSTNGLIRDPSTFSAGVVTADGTQYLLRIEDPVKFQNFANKVSSKSGILIWTKYDNSILASNTPEINEKNFIQFIDGENTGLKLFRGNDNFTSWQPLKVANNTVTTTSCN